MEILKETPLSVLLIIIGVLLWYAKRAFDRDMEESKRNTFVTQQNTITAAELRVELKMFRESLDEVKARLTEVEKDNHAFHAWKREMQANQ